MENLKTNSEVPLYQQLYDKIRGLIETGEYRTGDKIPSEGKLSEIYGISRITVRNSLQQLVNDNYLVKKHGKGTFVSQPAHVESMASGNSFTKSCLQMNAVPSTKVISISVQPAGKEEASALGVNLDDKVICIKRIRLVNDTPAIFEIDFFNLDFSFLLSADLEHTPIQETIYKKTGILSYKEEDIFEVKFATKEHGMHLDCVVGYPLLKVSQKVIMENEKILYYNEQYIFSERYKFAMRSCIR